MAFKLKSGNTVGFKNMGSSPAKHYVDDVPDHNDGHSDDLQTPEEHAAGKSPAKQAKQKGLGPRKAFGGVKNPELTKTKKPFDRKVMKDGPKKGYTYKDPKTGKTVRGTDNWQPHQFRKKKSPAKQTDSTFADGSKKSTRNKFDDKETKKETSKEYWYKIDGKKATKAQYLKYKNNPGNMEGGGKQTNNPDVYGRIANNHGRGSKTKSPVKQVGVTVEGKKSTTVRDSKKTRKEMKKAKKANTNAKTTAGKVKSSKDFYGSAF